MDDFNATLVKPGLTKHFAMSSSKLKDENQDNKSKHAEMEPMVNTIPDKDIKSSFCQKDPIFEANLAIKNVKKN